MMNLTEISLEDGYYEQVLQNDYQVPMILLRAIKQDDGTFTSIVRYGFDRGRLISDPDCYGFETYEAALSHAIVFTKMFLTNW